MKPRTSLGMIGIMTVLFHAPVAGAATYTVDQDHSTVEFRIHHLRSFVRGTFNQFEGEFEYVPDHPEQWKAGATIQAASIDTRVEKRDAHLRSKDFLDGDQYPTITFTSTKVTDLDLPHASLHGLLTIHGVQKPVVLSLTIHGVSNDPWDHVRAGFTATTMINRKDFGLMWNKVLETGQLLVGEDVEIILDIEGVQKTSEELEAPGTAQPMSPLSK